MTLTIKCYNFQSQTPQKCLVWHENGFHDLCGAGIVHNSNKREEFDQQIHELTRIIDVLVCDGMV